MTKLESLRAQRDMLQAEVADIRQKDSALAQHAARSPSALHTPAASARSPPAIAAQLEAGLRALSQSSHSPLVAAMALASPAAVPANYAGSNAWSVLRTPGVSASPSGSPAVQSPLSVDELRTIVAS